MNPPLADDGGHAADFGSSPQTRAEVLQVRAAMAGAETKMPFDNALLDAEVEIREQQRCLASPSPPPPPPVPPPVDFRELAPAVIEWNPAKLKKAVKALLREDGHQLWGRPFTDEVRRK
jgi:hypothetical protein